LPATPASSVDIGAGTFASTLARTASAKPRNARYAYHVAGNVKAALSAWPCQAESVTPLAGGWNSKTWLVVTLAGQR
jgi:hypothetical protein